jgi:hypothetical protein
MAIYKCLLHYSVIEKILEPAACIGASSCCFASKLHSFSKKNQKVTISIYSKGNYINLLKITPIFTDRIDNKVPILIGFNSKTLRDFEIKFLKFD